MSKKGQGTDPGHLLVKEFCMLEAHWRVSGDSARMPLTGLRSGGPVDVTHSLWWLLRSDIDVTHSLWWLLRSDIEGASLRETNRRADGASQTYRDLQTEINKDHSLASHRDSKRY